MFLVNLCMEKQWQFQLTSPWYTRAHSVGSEEGFLSDQIDADKATSWEHESSQNWLP